MILATQLCPDVAAICIRLSQNLYLRDFAKTNPAIVQAYVDVIMRMVESGDFVQRYNPTGSGIQYLSWIHSGLYPGGLYSVLHDPEARWD